MYIELTLDGQHFTEFPLSDKILEDVPSCSKEENFKARERIIQSAVEQIRKENEPLFRKRNIQIWLRFESRGEQETNEQYL